MAEFTKYTALTQRLAHSMINETPGVGMAGRPSKLQVNGRLDHPRQPALSSTSNSKPEAVNVSSLDEDTSAEETSSSEAETTDDARSVVFKGSQKRPRLYVPETARIAAKYRDAANRRTRAVTAPFGLTHTSAEPPNPLSDERTPLPISHPKPTTFPLPNTPRHRRSASAHPSSAVRAASVMEPRDTPRSSRGASTFDQRAVSPETERSGLEVRLNRMKDEIAVASFSPTGNGPALVARMFELSTRLTTLRQDAEIESEQQIAEAKGAKRTVLRRELENTEPAPERETKRPRLQPAKPITGKEARPSSSKDHDEVAVVHKTVFPEPASSKAVRHAAFAETTKARDKSHDGGCEALQKRIQDINNDASLSKNQKKTRKKRLREEAAEEDQAPTPLQACKQEQRQARQQDPQSSIAPLPRSEFTSSSPCLQATTSKQQKEKRVVATGIITMTEGPQWRTATALNKLGEIGPENTIRLKAAARPNKFNGFDRPVAEALRSQHKNANRSSLQNGSSVSSQPKLSRFDRFLLETCRQPKTKAEATKSESKARPPTKTDTAKDAEQVIDLCNTSDGHSSTSSSDDEDEKSPSPPSPSLIANRRTSQTSSRPTLKENMSAHNARNVPNGKDDSRKPSLRDRRSSMGMEKPSIRPSAGAQSAKSPAREDKAQEGKPRATRAATEAPSQDEQSRTRRSKLKPPETKTPGLTMPRGEASMGTKDKSKREDAQAAPSSDSSPGTIRSPAPSAAPASKVLKAVVINNGDMASTHREGRAPRESVDKAVTASESSPTVSKTPTRSASKAAKKSKKAHDTGQSPEKSEKNSKSRKRALSLASNDGAPVRKVEAATNGPKSERPHGQAEPPSKKQKKAALATPPTLPNRKEPKASHGTHAPFEAASQHFAEIFKLTGGVVPPAKIDAISAKPLTTLPASTNVPEFKYTEKKDGRPSPKKKGKVTGASGEATVAGTQAPESARRKSVRPVRVSQDRKDVSSHDSSGTSSSSSLSAADPSVKEPPSGRDTTRALRYPLRTRDAPNSNATPNERLGGAANQTHETRRTYNEGNNPESESSCDEDDVDMTPKPHEPHPRSQNAAHQPSPSSPSQQLLSELEAHRSSSSALRDSMSNPTQEPSTQAAFKQAQPRFHEAMTAIPAKTSTSQNADSSPKAASQTSKQGDRSSQNDSAKKKKMRSRLSEGNGGDLPTTQAMLDDGRPFPPPSGSKSASSKNLKHTARIAEMKAWFKKPPSPQKKKKRSRSERRASQLSQGERDGGDGAKSRAAVDAETATPDRVSKAHERTSQGSNRDSPHRVPNGTKPRVATPTKAAEASNRRVTQPQLDLAPPSTPRASGGHRSALKSSKEDGKTHSPMFSTEETEGIDAAEDFLGPAFSLSDHLRTLEGSSSAAGKSNASKSSKSG